MITEETIEAWRINYGLDKRSPADAMRWWESNMRAAPSGAVAALGLCLEEIENLKRKQALCDSLHAKVQFLVDSWPNPLEDGGITFPDGEFWKQNDER